MFRADGGDARRQGHGARPPRRNSRRHPETHPFYVPCYEDAPDSARQGNRRRVHKESRVQVIYSISYSIHLILFIL